MEMICDSHIISKLFRENPASKIILKNSLFLFDGDD